LLLFSLIGGLYGYFGLLSPINMKITTVDSQIKQQQDLLKKNEAAIPVFTQDSNENTYPLQEEVPVKPLMDQLMLQFEKAEVLSDSLILSMQFTDSDDVADEEENTQETSTQQSTPAETGTNTQPSQPTSTTSATTDEKSAQNTTDTAANSKVNVTPEALPEGVKKVTAEMSVLSKNYEGLLKFLQTIEDFKRVTVIEGITFTGLTEIERAAAKASPDQLKYDVTISAYYLPELTDYLKDLPKGDFPAPNGKENPLSGAEPNTKQED
jgi:type IV pilus assembly protein PilO